MSKQLHKIFSNNQVKLLLKSYLNQEIKMKYVLQMLQIKRSKFFELLTRYRNNPDNFSIQYNKNISHYRIDLKIEVNIIKELKKDRKRFNQE